MCLIAAAIGAAIGAAIAAAIGAKLPDRMMYVTDLVTQSCLTLTLATIFA